MKRYVIAIFFICTCALTLAGAEEPQSLSIPDTYRGISLGMDQETVQAALQADPIFGYRGERDVSLLPLSNRSLIDSTGSSFIRRSFFQFYEGKLYIMIFQLDPLKTDYYSLFSSLEEKYGVSDTLDPSKAVWKGERVILSLERPLTVKYLDVEVFEALVASGSANKAASDIERGEFINGF